MYSRKAESNPLSCQGWAQEGIYRLLLNVLHPDVAEKPQELIVYGGKGKAVRSQQDLVKILNALRALNDEETLPGTGAFSRAPGTGLLAGL